MNGDAGCRPQTGPRAVDELDRVVEGRAGPDRLFLGTTRALEGGARKVWVVSPKLHTVTVYRSLTDIVTLTANDKVDGGEVVPGFQINVAEIFG